jgi:hypothetical protein
MEPVGLLAFTRLRFVITEAGTGCIPNSISTNPGQNSDPRKGRSIYPQREIALKHGVIFLMNGIHGSRS